MDGCRGFHADNLALLFAIGIAIGLAEENNGVAGWPGQWGTVLTGFFHFRPGNQHGVLSGIISGVLAALLYNKYKAIKVPDFLGFFGGKRFVPIVTSLYGILGAVAGYVWPLIQGI